MTYSDAEQRRALALFGDLLDYPTAALPAQAAECEALLASADVGATPLIGAFRTYVDETTVGRQEETYTGFFDLNAVCHPYVGYQLFGESYKRSSFLLKLRELYRAETFQHDVSELSDRLSIILRFVAHSRDEEQRGELIAAGVLPALSRMIGADSDSHDDESVAGGDGGLQLEGHSQGEVLDAGFVLALTEEGHGIVAPDRQQHPYHQLLQALHVVLERSWRVAPIGERPVMTGGGG